VGKAARNREKRRQQQHDVDLRPVVGEYDPTAYPPELLDPDKIVGQLGAPMDGWTPELTYRYATLIAEDLTIDWAIMIDVHRVELDGTVTRRLVERIDICESEIHIHHFRQSSDPRDHAGRREILTSISAGDKVTVSRAFDEQLALLSREWPTRVRRWIDG
jgi:hypothetical protein